MPGPDIFWTHGLEILEVFGLIQARNRVCVVIGRLIRDVRPLVPE